MSENTFNVIAVSSPSFSLSRRLVEAAGQLAKKIVVNSQGVKWSPESLVLWLNEHKADAAIIGTEILTRDMIAELPYLKAIGKYGVGMDNIDENALKERGIFLGWKGGVNRRSVSELTLSFMLSHFRNTFRSINRMQAGEWIKNGGVQLSNRSIGIVGLGFIGTDLASLLQPFGAEIYFFDVLDKVQESKSLSIQRMEYEDMVRNCDVISFHVPGGVGTFKLYAEKHVQIAKPGQFIVNTSRSSVVEFDAVVKGVRSKKLGGFATDVFPEEPFCQKGYNVEDGFYFTPHIGGNAAEAVEAMGMAAIDGLKTYLSQV